ncbi:hypothetical protein I302_105995 [Kwoniella bestiolae CBS 10118]|uniref:Anaphase-promoting complex subunit 3 n=1 Tax=Kwoniella bestiolae CBS 10118 TaxID=1296100 RepID=A0A1B9G2R4_9TREE|nr:anaphase-promoting complex subunit 3 [Kwoniella bestiolae CBS 10118]OCF25305.1 anaphase-promoting complex subunit 3 [Kwoniella bestiolae CBS 10118]
MTTLPPFSPSQPHLLRRLQQLSLTSPTSTSLFYARIWYSLLPPTETEHESLHTLALCFLQSEEPYSALHLVRDTAGVDHPDDSPIPTFDPIKKKQVVPCYGCAIIVAKCCQKLGRYSEGQAVLNRALKRCIPTNLPTPSAASTSASAHLLLASMSHKGKAPEIAIENYQKALQEDPWLWEAFTGLCDIGSPPPLEAIFPDPPAPSRASSIRTSRPPTMSPNPMPRSSASEMSGFLPARKTSHLTANGGGGGFFTPDVGGGAGGSRLGMMGNPSNWDTPSAMGDTTFQLPDQPSHPAASKRPLPNLLSNFIPSTSNLLPASLRSNASTPVNQPEPAKPPAMKRARGKDAAKKPIEPSGLNGSNLPLARELKPNGNLKSVELNGHGHDNDGSVRRSSRLKSTTNGNGSSKPPSAASSKVTTRSRTTRSRSITSTTSSQTNEISSPPNSSSLDLQLQSSADEFLRDIVRRCAKAYRCLSLYQCQEAISELDSLPDTGKNSPWSLDIVARCFYEMADYVQARRVFVKLLELEPYRLHSMDHYSTLLWHISDPPSLSHLSQKLMSINKESSQSWISTGNCFSLQKDHEEAMRCFKRATQVDPSNAYAWTLCGYEAIEMEEYDRALGYFRGAIRCEGRFYNAWYGMGLVYMKTGKIKYAEHHFRRAVEINPTNAVLLCCVGMVLEQSDDVVQAIHFYERAVHYAPTSPMVQFKRIRALVALQRFDEAITLLEPLSNQAPDEANIFFLLGKCYLRKDRRSEATIAFTTARELQPKLENAIKATLEANGEEEEEEED